MWFISFGIDIVGMTLFGITISDGKVYVAVIGTPLRKLDRQMIEQSLPDY